MYCVEYTKGNRSRVLFSSEDEAAAIQKGNEEQARLRAAGKHGIITLYTVTTERGEPMRKCLCFWEV